MILVVGSINMDLVGRSPQIPRPGETLLGSTFTIEPGGKGGNQAVGAARLGARVEMVGRVGDDAFGAQLREALAYEGIDVNAVAIDQSCASGVALITVADDGDNSILVLPGANGRLSDGDVAQAQLVRADIVLLQLEIPLGVVTTVAHRAHALGIPVVLNPAPAQPLPDELLACTTWLTPNESEAYALTGTTDIASAAHSLRDRGVANVVVTLGGRGLCHVDEAGEHWMSAEDVQAVDTVGAGDALNAGLAVGLHEGLDAAAALQLASRAAGLQVSRPGAQRSMPTRDEITRRT